MVDAATAAAGAPLAVVVPDDPFAFVPRDAVIAVAMSGGVDSSVAAARCASSGRRTMGITLAMWPRDAARDRDRGCCSLDAVEDARRVASTLGIPHYSWNLEPEFTRAVVVPFADEYAAGRTPNPCVRCNREVKFGVLLERARAAGATHLATGHYARLGRRGPSATLHRARARAKDQSYTLHRLTQAQLWRSVLPLGAEGSKEQVRITAAELGLATAAKPDSQELCFVDGSLRADLEVRLAGRYHPGSIVDAAGRVLGEHRGVPFYTVGQRAGLDLAPVRPDTPPMYVTAVDRASNTVVVGTGRDLERETVDLEDVHWVGGAAPGSVTVEVQLRAHARPAPARLGMLAHGALRLFCQPPVTQVAPGQAAVIYDGDQVLGGGTVSSS